MKLLSLGVIVCLSIVLTCYGCSGEEFKPKTFMFVSVYHSSHWRPHVLIAKELHKAGHNIIFQLPAEFEGTENPSRELLSFAQQVRVAPVGYTPEFMREICQKMGRLSPTQLGEMIELGSTMLNKMESAWANSFWSLTKFLENTPVDVLFTDIDPGTITVCAVNNITCIMTYPLVMRYPDFGQFIGRDAFPSWFPVSSFAGIDTSITGRFVLQLGKFLTRTLLYLFSLRKTSIHQIQIDHGIDPRKVLAEVPVLINSFQGFDWNMPMPPHIKYIGPLDLDRIIQSTEQTTSLHTQYNLSSDKNLFNESTAIQFELFSWLEANSQIIVVSFGKSVEPTPEMMAEIVGFARQSGLAVLWSVRKHQLSLLPEDLPSNIRIETWIDFVSVIAHPHVRVVVSQCGVSSAHESVLVGVPILCIPILFDQYDLALLVSHNKVGETLHKEVMNADSLTKTITGMIGNETTYRENAKSLLRLAKRRPPMSEVVEWIEILAELGPDKFLPPVIINELPLFAYYELQIVLFLMAIILSSFVTCCCIKGWMRKCFCCCCGRKKIKIE